MPQLLGDLRHHEEDHSGLQGHGAGTAARRGPHLSLIHISTAIEPQPAIEVQIDKWVYGGASLARANGKVLMIPFALPGERVRVEIVKDHGGFAEARVQEWLERSPERVEPQCPVFARCGGCHYQHAAAQFQAARKAEITREVFRRVGKLDAPAEIGICLLYTSRCV